MQAVRWKTLYSIALPQLDRGTGIRERLSGRVFLKGFKVCGLWDNDEGNDRAYECHWAIIQEKDNQNSTALGVDFFRDTAQATTRVVDFTNDTTSSSWDIRIICNPINTQRYNVITHRRFWLAPDSLQVANKMIKKFEKYIPIKRKIEFESDSDAFNIKPWYLVYWWLPVRASDKDATVKNVNVNWKVQTYYSDGRM